MAFDQVGKHQLSACNPFRITPPPIHFLYNAVRLAFRQIGQTRIHQPQVNCRLSCQPVLQDRHIVPILFIQARKLFPPITPVANEVDELANHGRPLDHHFCRLSALDRWHTRQVRPVQHVNIRATPPQRRYFRPIHIPRQAKHLPIVTARSFLQVSHHGGECPNKVVERRHTELFQQIRPHIPEHGPHFSQRVRDRCSGRQHHVAAGRLALYPLGFHVEVQRAIARPSIQPLNPIHLRVKVAALVGMRLVHQQGVNTQLLERNQAVFVFCQPFQHPLHAGLIPLASPQKRLA